MPGQRLFARKDQKKSSATSPQGVTANLSSWFGVARVCSLLAVWVVGRQERSAIITEIFFELFFRASHKFTHSGVETVTARYQVESPCLAVFELNIDASRVLMDSGDAVAENGLDFVRDGVEDCFCQIAARGRLKKRSPTARRIAFASSSLLKRPR